MKRKTLKKTVLCLLTATALLLTCCLTSCSREKESIYILYTNDAHCSYLDNLGYDGVGAYKKEMTAGHPYVTLVDLGDAIHGNYIATKTEGKFPMQVMEKVGYDIAILGNHEFDYGVSRIAELTKESSIQYIACNIDYTGEKENPFADLPPYCMEEYGKTKVAFIGVTTPYAMISSTPSYFMEDGKTVYDFCSGDDGKVLQTRVQETVNLCRDKGADYVILLTHLEEEGEHRDNPYSCERLIRGTHGVDAILNSYSRRTVGEKMLKNDKGENVVLSASGTGLQNIGQLVITANGEIHTSLMTEYANKDSEITSYIETAQQQFEDILHEKVAHTEIDLPITDASGARIVRNRECLLGSLAADAYRMVSGADIGLMNGGSVRASMEKGDITYGDVLNVNPYGNTLCVVEMTGAELADVLEFSYKDVESKASENGEPLGEFGGFLHVSGLRVTVDASIPSPVLLHDDGMFAGVSDGARRVQKIEILTKDNTYVPLGPDKTYTVAAHDYLLIGHGDGYTMFDDNQFVLKYGIHDYEIVKNYINDFLGGVITEENAPTTGRIIIQ